MTGDPIAFITEDDMKRVFRAVRNTERQFAGGQLIDTPEPPGFDPGPATVIVEIYPSPAGSMTAGGFHRGKLITIGAVSDLAVDPAWEDMTSFREVAVFEVNRVNLEHSSRYVGWVYGMLGDITIIAVNCCGAESPLTTRNSDLTQSSTTTLLEFNQATGVKVTAGATPADPDVVAIDTTEFTYNVFVNVPTCLSIALTKTFASTQLGGQNVLTNVTAALTWKTIKVGMVDGTTVAAAGPCVRPTDCCPDGPAISICSDTLFVSRTLKVTVSGGPTFNVVYDALGGLWTGVNGPSLDCADPLAFGLNLTPNCNGTWEIGGVASFRGPNTATVTPTSTSPFLLTVTAAAESGLCGGTVTFTVSEV